MKRRLVGRQGFTLVEVIVVLAIMLVLAALAVPVLGQVYSEAQTIGGSVSNQARVPPELME